MPIIRAKPSSPAPMHLDAVFAEPTRERLRRASAGLDLAELGGRPFAMSQALAEVARCHLEIGARSSAEAHFEAAVRWARLCGSVDHVADLLCEAAEAAVCVALGRESESVAQRARPESPGQESELNPAAGHAARERARDRAFEVSQLAGRISDPSCEARLLLRVGEVLERCGDHADAVQMQVRAFNRLGGVAPRDASRLSGFGRLADG